MNNWVLKSLPIIDRGHVDLDTLEAELAMANKRVAQAVKRRDEIHDRIKPIMREKAIHDLEKRGIKLGETVVIVSQRTWIGENDWEYKKAIVMDVTVEERWSHDPDLDVHSLEMKGLYISYDFAAVKKDGKPSKAHSGIYSYGATIERIA